MSCYFAGGFFTTLPTALVELNGIENIVKSMAIWTLAVGAGFLLGTPFSGTCCIIYLQKSWCNIKCYKENKVVNKTHFSTFLCHSTGLGFDLLSLTSFLPNAAISPVFMVLCVLNFFCYIHYLTFLLSWACWDWPSTWLTNHCPLVLCHCWLGHLIHKIVPQNDLVWNGMLNLIILCLILVCNW